MVEQRIQRRANRPPGIQHIVHQDNVAPGHIEAQLALVTVGRGPLVDRSSR